jgi:hypothetical protein
MIIRLQQFRDAVEDIADNEEREAAVWRLLDRLASEVQTTQGEAALDEIIMLHTPPLSADQLEDERDDNERRSRRVDNIIRTRIAS